MEYLTGEIHKLTTRYKAKRDARLKELDDLERLTFKLKDFDLQRMTADQLEEFYEKWKVQFDHTFERQMWKMLVTKLMLGGYNISDKDVQTFAHRMNDKDNTQLMQAKENALKAHFAHFCMHAKLTENGDHDFNIDHRWTNSAGDMTFFATRLQDNQAYAHEMFSIVGCGIRWAIKNVKELSVEFPKDEATAILTVWLNNSVQACKQLDSNSGDASSCTDTLAHGKFPDYVPLPWLELFEEKVAASEYEEEFCGLYIAAEKGWIVEWNAHTGSLILPRTVQLVTRDMPDNIKIHM